MVPALRCSAGMRAIGADWSCSKDQPAIIRVSKSTILVSTLFKALPHILLLQMRRKWTIYGLRMKVLGRFDD